MRVINCPASTEELFDELLARKPEMHGHLSKDRGQRPDAKRIMPWDGYVVFSVLVRG